MLLIGASMCYSMFTSSAQVVTWEQMNLTPETIVPVLTGTAYVHDMPSDGNVALFIGNNAYTLTKGSVLPGEPAQPDVTIRIPAAYLEVIGDYGPCAALAIANQHGDLAVELHGSSTSLGWKYKKLIKYKSCLG